MWREILFCTAMAASICPQRLPGTPHPQPASVGLTVSVFNDAEVPRTVLLVAQERTILVLGQAGVSLNWLDCGEPDHRVAESGCSAISFPTHFSVRLVNKAPVGAEDTFGQSFLDAVGEGSYANIYVGSLESSKAASALNRGDLLGYVVAHEVGHLLLGPDSHSATGVMCAVWQRHELDVAARGGLFFTRSQAERMRSRYLLASERLKRREPARNASGN